MENLLDFDVSHKKIIVCDLDGTLTPSRKPVSEDMVVCVKELIKNGREFCILAGGTLSLVKEQFLDYFNFKKTVNIFCVSGTKHYISRDGVTKCNRIEQRKYFNKLEKNRVKNEIMNFVNEENIVPITSYSDQIEFRGTQITFSALGRNAPLEAKKKFDPDKKKRKRWLEYFRVLFPNYEIRIGGTTSIDFTKKGLNKLYGIKIIKSILNVETNQIIYFGDSFSEYGNDEPVLGYVDCIVVKNELDTLKIFKQIINKNTVPYSNLRRELDYSIAKSW